MPAEIKQEQPDTEIAIELVNELEDHLAAQYPAESRHGYSPEKLIREGVAFFVIRVNGEPAGCGGIQLFGSEYGELKRMYVRPSYRGIGLGKQLIANLEEHALSNGVQCVRLETGIHQHEAIGLYERMGYERVGPFPPYREDPLSIFFEKNLQQTTYQEVE